MLKGLSAWGQPNLRIWQPEDPECFAEVISAEIGHRSQQGGDMFSLRVATPSALAAMEAKNGIIATRPLLVVDRYDFDVLWQWFDDLLAREDGRNWRECVERLRRYLDWEYDNYSE